MERIAYLYANMVKEFMKLVSMSYDLTTSNIEAYTKTLNSMNEYFFGVKEGHGELERIMN